MPTLLLPTPNGNIEPYKTSDPVKFFDAPPSELNRVAFSAAHVVADPLSNNEPWLKPSIDWEATLNYRRYLWGLGLGVAEAMDTAQRGMGLDWATSFELIKHSIDASKDFGGKALLACGAGTDHLDPNSVSSINTILDAYLEQCSAVEKVGGRIILMASRALAACAQSADDYKFVYNRVLSQVSEPVIIHWLGEMFDPALEGYWGNKNHETAMSVCIDIIKENKSKIDGIKISLLDSQKEVAMRRLLPAGVRMYTGDDFNYPELIEGDEFGHSDALLGIFDAIAPAASSALSALANGDVKGYRDILEPTVPLARHIFEPHTRFYKTGIVFLAYLNDLQDHFIMVGGQQSARSLLHFVELFKLADNAGLLKDPTIATSRMTDFLKTYGIGN
jgi:hypothetical protein